MIGMRLNFRLDKIFVRKIFQNIMFGSVKQNPFLVGIAVFILARDRRVVALPIQIIDKNNLTARNDPLIRLCDQRIQVLQRDMRPDKAAEKRIKRSGNSSFQNRPLQDRLANQFGLADSPIESLVVVF